MTVHIEGMTCRSCEITLERNWKKLPGVKSVEVNAATGKGTLIIEGDPLTLDELQKAVGDEKYQVRQDFPTLKNTQVGSDKQSRPTFWQLIGLFALVFLIGKILSRFGLLGTSFNVTETASFGAIFVVGLVAASSSCIAVVGGLLLSSSARFNEKYPSLGRVGKMRPVVLFVLGRIVSYTLLGGLLGVIGGVLSPSPLVTAIITLIAALYMLIMGLEMLHMAPSWLKVLLPRTSKSLSHKIVDAEGKDHPAMPFLLGGATFFLPCGFTQALQLYALTTGSFTTAALMLLAFALGTAPALLALGFASSSLKGKLGKFFFQFSGALVIVLGLWNIQNALSIAGFTSPLRNANSIAATGVKKDPNVKETNGVQVVKMKVSGITGYDPDEITIEAGKPVRWEVDGTDAGGCSNVIVARKLGIQKVLKKGINVIQFTPKEVGRIAFSCSMGMYRGSFNVVASKS